ncbi:hypothetical protein CRYUN_Cryun07bG0000600 [Craigia yunnanensis]
MEDSAGGVSLPSGPDVKKRRVTYFYEPTIGDYYYGQGHPMKPHRIRMAHNLIIHYSLHRRMEINRPFPAGAADIRRFNTEEYVDFLNSVTPEFISDPTYSRHLKRFNVGEDWPVFDGLFGFGQASAGGSIGAAVKLNRGDADIAINWAGGLHHAKKNEASGFCYVNDIVLGILELLKVHRELDISGTLGVGNSKYYALNVPLNDGMDDESFQGLFRPLIQKVMEVYQPDAVVLQCGADSLSGDRLGCFNLSVKGYADCLRFLGSFNVPLMVLCGGGYTIRNVARCWCYETAVAVGVDPDNRLPDNEYYEYFGPDYTLHVEPGNMENLNAPRDMEKIRNTLLEQLSRLSHAPSIPFRTTPSTIQPPEEISSQQQISSIVEEDMGERPKPRIWNGDDYESDPEDDEKPLRRFSNSDVKQPTTDAEMRYVPQDLKEVKAEELAPS